MIDFRYHIVSIVAIFLALAVGIALGSGPLKPTIDATLQNQTKQLREEKDALRQQLTELQNDQEATAGFAARVAPLLLDGRLVGDHVVLVAAPNADAASVDAVAKALHDAGAVVTGTVSVRTALVDQDRTDQIASLLTGLAPNEAPTDASSEEKIAAVIARTLVTDSVSAEGVIDGSAEHVLSGLAQAGLVQVSGQPAAQAGFAVVVAGPAVTPSTSASDATVARMRDLSLALDRASRGAVVAGPPEAAADGGLLAAVRGDGQVAGEVSTVDDIGTPLGSVGLVFALIEQTRGDAGQYGTGPRADAAVPDLTGSPSATATSTP